METNNNNETKPVVTFKRVQTGLFHAYLNGEKTEWQIINGSLGMSGRDTVNIYGITRDGMTAKWLGPLRTCKAAIEYTLTKRR